KPKPAKVLPRRPGRLPNTPRRSFRYHDPNLKPRTRHLPQSPMITTTNFNKSPIKMMPPLSLSINGKSSAEETKHNVYWTDIVKIGTSRKTWENRVPPPPIFEGPIRRLSPRAQCPLIYYEQGFG
ncbi:hypothetical protein L9F63_017912, partial [Diploptera punctata]